MIEEQGKTVTWTEQDEVLRALWQGGESPEIIARELRRTVAAVMTRAARLGLPRRFAPGRKPRLMSGGILPVAPSRAIPPSEELERLLSQTRRGMRVCLMCSSLFQSAGPQNRICPRCKESPDYEAGNRLPDLNFPV